MKTIKFFRPLLATVFIGFLALAAYGQEKRFQVITVVQAKPYFQDEQRMQQELQSHIEKELRSLGDVGIVNEPGGNEIILVVDLREVMKGENIIVGNLVTLMVNSFLICEKTPGLDGEQAMIALEDAKMWFLKEKRLSKIAELVVDRFNTKVLKPVR